SEPVDRLLRIADEEYGALAARVRLEERATKDVPLRLVGVLELVDEHEAPAVSQAPYERAAARSTQRVVDQRQHVVEVVLTRLSLPARELGAHGGQGA